MTIEQYEVRYAAAITELHRAGIWRWNAVPPYLQLMRRLSFQPRPPHYRRFTSVMLSFWASFSLVLGASVYLVPWKSAAQSLSQTLGATLLAGFVFGLSRALVYLRDVRKYQLSR